MENRRGAAGRLVTALARVASDAIDCNDLYGSAIWHPPTAIALRYMA